MTRQHTQLALLAAGTLLFNYVFWHEAPGINVLIYSFFVLGALLIRKSPSLSVPAWAAVTGTIVSAAMVVMHGSVLAVLVHLASLTLAVGLAHQHELKSVWFGYAASLATALMLPLSVGRGITFGKWKGIPVKRSWYYLRLSIIPVLVAFVFYFLYMIANPQFGSINVTVIDGFADWLENALAHLSFQRAGFVIVSFILTAWIVFDARIGKLISFEDSLAERIFRTRKTKEQRLRWSEYAQKRNLRPPFKTLALKHEYRLAALLLLMVNLLLLSVNVVDIYAVWLGNEIHLVGSHAATSSSSMELSQAVHDGTWILIASILLSMAIMVWIFRGSQNFFSKGSRLKALAYAWIIQNAVLALSVALRNWEYIDALGLAHKRIGVMVFLLMVVFGLATLWRKITGAHSLWHLVNVNGWAVYGVFIVLCCFNWDVLVTNYNLSNTDRASIDVGYILRMSDRALVEFDRQPDRDALLNHAPTYAFARTTRYNDYETYYTMRVDRATEKLQDDTWLSWNGARHSIANHFTTE